MSDLARPNNEIVMWITQPEKFLALLEKRLGTYQKAYRTKLPPDELKIWCDALKGFSVQEFDAAMKELLSHPPKYQLDDGSIQVWRGMPKLPDVLQTMIEGGEKRLQEEHRRESYRESAKMRELQRRKDAGEKFYGMADLEAEAKRLLAAKITPPAEDQEAKLERQKKELLK